MDLDQAVAFSRRRARAARERPFVSTLNKTVVSATSSSRWTVGVFHGATVSDQKRHAGNGPRVQDEN